MGGKYSIKGDIADAEGDAGDPEIADSVKYGPNGIIAAESGFGLFFME